MPSSAGSSYPATGAGGAASSASNVEQDETAFVLGLYAGLGSLPRAAYVRRLASVVAATDAVGASAADDSMLLLHLTQLEDLLLQYLKPSEYQLAPQQPAAPNAPASAAAAAASAPVVAAPGVLAPARVPTLLFHSAEFTQHFLEVTVTGVVRNLLQRHYHSGYSLSSASMHHARGAKASQPAAPAANEMVPRVNHFLQLVLRVIAKHLSEPTVPTTLMLPAPTPAPAAGAAPVEPPAEPTLVPVKVNPLFADSVSGGLMTTLLRLFDKERPLYAFYDKPSLGPQPVSGVDEPAPKEGQAEGAAPGAEGEDVAAGAASSSSAGNSSKLVDVSEPAVTDDDLVELVAQQVADAKALGEAGVKLQFYMGLDDHITALAASRRDQLAVLERARADRIRAREVSTLQQGLQPKPVPYQYSNAEPGAANFGLMQSNIQTFGAAGGFTVILERLSVGFNSRIDSRVPVAARRGHNPAQGSREPFYQRERARRVRWAKQLREDRARAEGKAVEAHPDPKVDEESLGIDPPIIQGSFPSIAPYLTQASFVTPPPGGLTRIPLHRGRSMLEPLLKLVQGNFVSGAFFSALCAHVKDVMIIRLLHLQPEESRLCDKEFLTNLLQEFVWRFIKHLSVHYQNNSWEAIKWPMLDTPSNSAFQAMALKEASVEFDPAQVEAPRIAEEPPQLFELNLNADELMESITIFLSYRLFLSPLLEKRINGLSDLTRFVELTNVRRRYDDAAAAGRPIDNRGAKVPVTAWLNQHVLSNYLLDVAIMDDIVGKYPAPAGADAELIKTHPQLIQRSDDVVRYLARLGKLTDTHLRQIWAASIGKHESVEQAVYSLLASVARTLTTDHILLVLKSCVSGVPYTNWNARTLKLLLELARARDDAVGDAKLSVDAGQAALADQSLIADIVVRMLWSVITLPHVPADTSNKGAAEECFGTHPANATARIPFLIRQQAAAQLQSLLAKPTLERLRRRTLIQIMDLVTARTCVRGAPAVKAPSTESIGMLLWTLSGLVSAYSLSQTENPRWKIIQVHVSLPTLFNELSAYCAAARENVPAVLAAVRKRLGSRRRVPDAALLVLTGSALEPAGDAGTFGIGLADLDASVTLPHCLENSTELLDSLRHDGAPYVQNSGPAHGASSGGASGAGAAPSGRSSVPTPNSVSYSEAFSHELEVLIRLELIRYLLSAAFEPIKGRDVDQLADALAGTRAVSPRALAHFNSWLRWMHVPKLTTPPTWVALAEREQSELYAKGKTMMHTFSDVSRATKECSEAVARYLFQKHLCAVPGANHTVPALKEGEEDDEEPPQVVSPPPSEGDDDAAAYWARMDESAFVTWRHYFLVINEAAKQVVLHAPLSVGAYNLYSRHAGTDVALVPARSGIPPPVVFGVVPGAKTLLGLEHLWNICLHAEQPAVVALAVDLLIQVYACPVSKSEVDAASAVAKKSSAPVGAAPVASPSGNAKAAQAEWRYSQREKFLARCMEFIKGNDAFATTATPQAEGQASASAVSAATANVTTAADSARVLRCLNLLQNFMQVVAQAEPAEGEKDAAEDGSAGPFSTEPWSLTVRLGTFGRRPEETLQLDMLDGQTVREVKARLAEQLGNVRASNIGMVLMQAPPTPARELLNYEVLTSARIQPASTLIALRAATKLSNVNHPGNDGRMPGEEGDDGELDDEDEAALQLARNFTPATPGPGGALPAGAFPGANVAATATTPATVQAAQSRAPTHVLANRQEYFDTLFALLPNKGSSSKSISPESHEIGQRVWKLLTSLPTNQRLLEEMKALKGIPESGAVVDANASASDVANSPWSGLLDPAAPFKLLYSLRILRQLAAVHLTGGSTGVAGAPAPAPGAARDYLAGIEWRNRFLRLGGAQYLYVVLHQLLEQRAASIPRTSSSAAGASAAAPESTDLAEWDECRNSCLLLLLQLFGFFLVVAQSQSNAHVNHLLPEVIPELESHASPEAGLQALVRALHSETAFLASVDFPALTGQIIRLMADCARSVSKSYRAAGGAASVAAKSATGSKAGAGALADAGSQDDALIRPAMLLLSSCILHRPTIGSTAADSATTPLTVLMSVPSLPTLFSTLFFLVPPSISQEQGEAWLSLATHSRRQAEAEIDEASHAGVDTPGLAQRIAQPRQPPLALHRFLFTEILLKVLPPVCAKSQYAAAAQDFFTLLVLLARDLLSHDLRVAAEGRSAEQVLPAYDWTALMQRAVSWMKSRPILESKTVGAAAAPASTGSKSSAPRSIEIDNVLIGLMNLVASLVHLMPALKDLCAVQPKHAQEAEEQFFGSSNADADSSAIMPVTSTGRLSRGDSLSRGGADASENPAAGLVLEVFLYLFDLPSMRTGAGSQSLPPPPKAKRRATRLAAFHLLLELANNHRANFVRLTGLLLSQNLRHNNVSSSNESEFDPTEYDKSSTGYVGLTNLTATCYLNSMMQQLFMMPEFRNKVLAVDTTPCVVAAAEAEKKTNTPTAAAGAGASGATVVTTPATASGAAPADSGAAGVGADNLLYQLQMLFGSLQEGEKKSYNPASFCRAFRDHDGKPIDVRVQQDVDEFFNALCDRLEAALKANKEECAKLTKGADSAETPEPIQPNASGNASVVPDLVKETFGGELEHQLLCQDCPHTSFRTEAFSALPLSVANKSTLQSSLDTFITGEMLEGDNSYLCSICKKKVRTLKRVVVKTLPQILVLNLKRFSFDYENFVKVKLNDRLAFPLENLDMEPYTAAGLARREGEKAGAAVGAKANEAEEQKEESKSDALPSSGPALSTNVSMVAQPAGPPSTYHLVGVLLHSGNSESGHYTSLVKERLPSGAETGRWLEFNDSVVRDFDPANIPAEAFGGANVVSVYDAKQRRKVNREVEKTRSAYLLIYARDQPAGAHQAGSGAQQGGALVTPQHSPMKRAASTTRDGDASHVRGSSGQFAFESPRFGASSPALLPGASSRARSPPPMDGGGLSPPAVMPKVSRTHSGPGLSARIHARPDIGTGDDPMDAMVAGSPAFSRLNSLELSLSGGGASLPGSPAGVRTSGASQGGSSNSSCNMPPQILERIWDDNLRFLRNKQLFQPDYFRFLVALLKRAPLPEAADGALQLSGAGDESSESSTAWQHVQLGVTFLTDVLAHAKYATNPLSYSKDAAARRALGEEEDLPPPGPARLRAVGGRLGIEHRNDLQIDCTPAPHSLLNEYQALIASLLEAHLPAARWFLRDVLIPSRLRLRYFLFECSSQLMRDTLVELCATVMRVVAPTERHLYDKQTEVEIKPAPPSATGATAATTVSAATDVATVATAQEPPGPQTMLVNRSLVLQFIDQVMQFWRDLQWQWRSLSQYFGLLHSFALMGYNERKYLLQVHELIKHAVDLYMGDLSPWARAEKYRRPVMGDLAQDEQPNWHNTFALLATLLCSTLAQQPTDDPDQTLLPPTFLGVQHGTVPLPIRGDAADLARQRLEADEAKQQQLQQGENSDPTPSPPPASSRWVILARPSDADLTHSYLVINAPVLSAADGEMIYNQDFVSKLLRDGCNPDANRLLVQHVCFGQQQVDAFVCRTWLKLMDDANYDRFGGLLSLLPPLLALQDAPLCTERLERYLNPRSGLIFKAEHWASSYPIFTFVVLKWLMLELGQTEGHPARDYLRAHKDDLYWALRWFNNYHNRELQSRAVKPMPPTDAELQRVAEAQQVTMDSLVAWFGEEWLVDREERDKRALEQHKAEQAARKLEAEQRAAEQRAAGVVPGDPLVAASGAAAGKRSAVPPARGANPLSLIGGSSRVPSVPVRMSRFLAPVTTPTVRDDDDMDNERPDQTEAGFAFGDTDDEDPESDPRGRMQSPGGRFSNDDDPDDLDGDEGVGSGNGGALLPPASDDEDTDDLDGTADSLRSLRVQGHGSVGVAPVPRGPSGLPPLTSGGRQWPPGGGVIRPNMDDDDELHNYMDPDEEEDPVELVRKFEAEQQRKAAEGRGE